MLAEPGAALNMGPTGTAWENYRRMTCNVRGWEQDKEERLPPGYRVDTTDAAIWTLRRPDGTVAGYFGACGASRRAVEKAARDDYRRRASHSTQT
jgi:hypothetical protein